MNERGDEMRKLGITLSIVLSSIFFTNGAKAQNRPLACQVEASAGLSWENGRWVTTRFITEKFILVQSGQILTADSVTKAMGFKVEYSDQTSCTQPSVFGDILCVDRGGTSLFFSPKTLRGGISKLFGSTTDGARRDTVAVDVFSCTPF